MNILIADSNKELRKKISSYLEKRRFNVFEASNGIETFTTIIENPINIAVIDWLLPGMSGLEVCRKIREKQDTNYVFIIMIAPKEEKEDLIQGFKAGVDEYIMRPINLQELRSRIKVGTRIVKLEKKLIEKQRELTGINQMKNKFIGIVAHDLRNPLISIRGFSELILKDNTNLNEEQNEFLNIIHSTSRNMLAMINDLLDISRIESGNLQLDLKPGSLNKLIIERIKIIEVHATSKHITIHKELSPITEVVFDAQRLGQAVDNLISNAIKFAPTGSNVYLNLSQDAGIARFSVTDEGPGIPIEEQHLLFSEFHRLSIRPTGGETSTGLGLAIAKKIIEAHNGSIEFETQEGMGSTFSLLLPASSKDTPPEAQD
jgi:signal transduction histidine kinase